MSEAEFAAEFDAAVAVADDKAASARALFCAKAQAERRLAVAAQFDAERLARAAARVEVMEARDRRLSAEKAIVLAELQKAEAARNRLQELCRSLQKTNREEIERGSKRVEDEIVKRKDITDRFAGTIEVGCCCCCCWAELVATLCNVNVSRIYQQTLTLCFLRTLAAAGGVRQAGGAGRSGQEAGG